ncbi:MAG: ABC transporter substrate-binding protein [Bacteriovoracia bacterium]
MGALAESWEAVAEKVYRFKLRKDVKWSDGTKLTAADVKKSFERGFKKYPEDLRSLINIVKDITAPSESVVEFHLSTPTSASNLLGKLTEPNFGVLKVKADGNVDLSTTTGAFYLSKDTNAELVLKRNPQWIFGNDKMPEEIIIRKPEGTLDLQKVMLEDSWANLVEVNSLIPGDLLSTYKSKKYEVWTRPLDKIFLLQLSKNFVTADGTALFRYLYKSINRTKLTEGLSGFSATAQVFPIGYQLFDDSFPTPVPNSNNSMPERFKRTPLRVLLASTRVNPILQKNIKAVLTDALGIAPEYIFTTLDKLGEHKRKGDYDIYVSTMGMADPDPEGAMSYYFEGDTPVVRSGNEPFVARLDAARKESDSSKRLKMMRSIMTDATIKGHVLPLFHLSTLAIGGPELDFRDIPTSDESVTFSKIRFKGLAGK